METGWLRHFSLLLSKGMTFRFHCCPSTVWKLALLGVAAVFFPASVYSQASPQEPTELFGPVSELVIEERILSGSTASSHGAGTRREVLRFEKGVLVEQANYIPENKLLWRSIFDYNSDGRLSGWTSLDDGGNQRWRYEYRYTDTGLIEREIARGAGDSIEEIRVYEYQEDRMQEETLYGAGNQVRWRKAYRYDEEERTRSWSVFHSDGTRIKHVEEEFDQRGRIIREAHTDGLGAVYKEVFYDYSVWDAPVRVEVFDETGTLVRYEEYELDATGNIIAEEITREGEERKVQVLREYSYDSYGNWTSRRTRSLVRTEDTREVTREMLVTREITYRDGG